MPAGNPTHVYCCCMYSQNKWRLSRYLRNIGTHYSQLCVGLLIVFRLSARKHVQLTRVLGECDVGVTSESTLLKYIYTQLAHELCGEQTTPTTLVVLHGSRCAVDHPVSSTRRIRCLLVTVHQTHQDAKRIET